MSYEAKCPGCGLADAHAVGCTVEADPGAVIDIRPAPQAPEIVKAAEAYRKARMRGSVQQTIEAADALAVAVLNAKAGA